MILDFGNFTRRRLLADLERLAEIWAGQIADRAVGVKPERRRKKTEKPLTCLRLESERLKDSASSQEIPMILNALVFTA